ncbi:glycosyltransferase family 4 protein [Desulfosediminicola sp.]|uniref:glycosyltransferase family 4 protein n=1 Tax=Desulfosediminicola sp. TaxID=2886825 RepID=UPI003AF306FA
MLVNFFNSEMFRNSYVVTFSYVRNSNYELGFKQRVHRDLPNYPLNFPNLSDYSKVPKWFPLLVKKLIMASLRLFLHLPLLAYQTYILFRLLKRINPEILHINNGGYPAARSALAAAIAGKLAGTPIVIMVVNNMASNYRHFSRWFDYPIDKIVVSSVHMFFTGSKEAARRLEKVLNLPAEKIRTIHNGIALRDLKSTAEDTRRRIGINDVDGVVFGVVALLIPRKGHQILLNAILKLITERKFYKRQFKILIEGDGPLKNELVDFVEQNGLTQWVTFVGNEKNIVDFMAVLDVLVLPSVQDEDFPNVILEAMALGKPVIASRLAGTPEQVVDGLTGFLVEPRNVDQLSEAMFRLLIDPDTRNELGRAALNRFNDNFTSEIALENYAREYSKLLNSQL